MEEKDININGELADLTHKLAELTPTGKQGKKKATNKKSKSAHLKTKHKAKVKKKAKKTKIPGKGGKPTAEASSQEEVNIQAIPCPVIGCKHTEPSIDALKEHLARFHAKTGNPDKWLLNIATKAKLTMCPIPGCVYGYAAFKELFAHMEGLAHPEFKFKGGSLPEKFIEACKMGAQDYSTMPAALKTLANFIKEQATQAAKLQVEKPAPGVVEVTYEVPLSSSPPILSKPGYTPPAPPTKPAHIIIPIELSIPDVPTLGAHLELTAYLAIPRPEEMKAEFEIVEMAANAAFAQHDFPLIMLIPQKEEYLAVVIKSPFTQTVQAVPVPAKPQKAPDAWKETALKLISDCKFDTPTAKDLTLDQLPGNTGMASIFDLLDDFEMTDHIFCHFKDGVVKLLSKLVKWAKIITGVNNGGNKEE